MTSSEAPDLGACPVGARWLVTFFNDRLKELVGTKKGSQLPWVGLGSGFLGAFQNLISVAGCSSLSLCGGVLWEREGTAPVGRKQVF